MSGPGPHGSEVGCAKSVVATLVAILAVAIAARKASA